MFQASGDNYEDRNGPIEDMVSLFAGLFGKRDAYIMALAERGAESTAQNSPAQEYVGLTAKSRILLVCDSREESRSNFWPAPPNPMKWWWRQPDAHLAHLTREQFAGVYVSSEYLQEALEIGKLLQNEQILEGMPDGVVLLDADNTILWGNGRLREWSGCDR